MDGDDIQGSDELDPKQAAMVAKLRRLVTISTSIMLIGFLAVMSVIAYRLVKSDGDGQPQAGREHILDAPAGSRIIGVAADDGLVYVTVSASDGTTRIHVLHGDTFEPRGTISVR